jgi:HEAT repeat protein
MDLKLLADTPPYEWPGDAGRTFRKLLNNPKAAPADRLIAAKLAGDYTVIDNDLANVLLAVLRNKEEPEELRAAAAVSFGPALEGAFTELDEESGVFDDPEMVPISEGQYRTIQDALQRIYRDAGIPKLVRRRILEASVRGEEPWHEEAIREAYASGDRDWILTAVFAMRHVGGFEKETLEALQSTDPKIHYEAVVGCGDKALDAAWPHLLKLIEEERTEKDLRIAAIGAIGWIRPAEARGILLELAGSDDEDISEAADEALSMLEPDLDEEDEEEDEDEEDEEDEDEEDEDEPIN